MSNEEALPEGLVGNVSYTNRQYETFKLKKADDAFQFRPLPPMSATLKKRKSTGLYWKTHFGWKGLDEKGKERLRPFLCPEEKRDGRITHNCAACNLRKDYEDTKNALVAKKKAIEEFAVKNKKSPADTRKALQATVDELKAANDWLYDHGCDGKFRQPCINRQGKIGILMMPFGAMKKFQEACRKLNQQMGLDPCGVKGVWFECTRNGPASRDSDDVQPVQIFNKEDGSSKLDFHVLDNATLIAASQAIPDLGELMEKGRITDEQITALVDCERRGCDPEEVDRILGIEKAAEPQDDSGGESSTKSATSVSDDDFGVGAATAASAFETKPEPSPEPETKTAQELKSAPPPAEDDEEAELERKLAAKRAAKAKAALEAAAAQAAPPKGEPAKVETKTAPPAKKAEPAKTETKAASAADVDDSNFEDLFNS